MQELLAKNALSEKTLAKKQTKINELLADIAYEKESKKQKVLDMQQDYD